MSPQATEHCVMDMLLAIYGLIEPLLEDVNVTQCSIYLERKGKVIKRLVFT
jgi:hypothetical protein